MHIYIISYMTVCCAQGRIHFFFFSYLFPVSLFIKCLVVSCVQIMECSIVLVTAQEDGNFHGWTGLGSEISPPVYIWKTTQFTLCA